MSTHMKSRLAVVLKDGTTLTQTDLPPTDTTRWVASRKAAVINGIKAGLLSEDEAIKRYGLSVEELHSWQDVHAQHGPNGLKVTALKTTKQPQRE